MSRELAIRIISRRNQWVNGEDIAPIPLSVLTEALDYAINEMMATELHTFQKN